MELKTESIADASNPFTDLDELVVREDWREVVVLTGASTGIGFATVKLLISRQVFVFATVRRAEDARRVAALGAGACPVELDICDAERCRIVSEQIGAVLARSDRPVLNALINNAGIALGGPLIELDDETLRRQMEVNLVAPMRLTRLLSSALGVNRGQRRGGRVIQVSSISGEQSMAFVGPYSASKFALEGLTDALRLELMPFGVEVISVKPGPISTEIWDKAPTPEENPFSDGLYRDALRRFYDFVVRRGRKGLPPVEIAKVIYTALTARRPRPRYVRTPEYFTRVLIPRLISTRRFNRIIGKLFHLTPELFHRATSSEHEPESDPASQREM